MASKLPSGKEAMAASKKHVMGDSSTANSTEDLTVDSPVSTQLVGSRPVKRARVELSKDEGVAVDVSEDANVLSDPPGTDSGADTDADSDVDSETDSDADSLTSPLECNGSRDPRPTLMAVVDTGVYSYEALVAAITFREEHNSLFNSRSPYQKSISDLKKEKAEIEEELKYNREKVLSLKLKLAREMAKHEKLVQLQEVANWGGVVSTDDIEQILKE